jgi:hypothetical protein
MTVHDGVQLLSSIGAITLVLLARDRLRMNAPRVRVALGAVGILFAALVFLVVMRLLPRPWESGFSAATDAITLVACFVIGGLFVLSLIETVGGIVQAIKRWRYQRRNLS